MPDTQAQDATAGAQDAAAQTETQTGAASAETPGRTYTEAEAKALRDEAAANRVKLRKAELALQALEDAAKTEAERLTDRVARAAVLETANAELLATNEALGAALTAEVERQKKTLPAEFQALIPAGNPAEQLAWIGLAAPAIEKHRAKGELPGAGQRQPATGSGKSDQPTTQEREKAARHYASRF